MKSPRIIIFSTCLAVLFGLLIFFTDTSIAASFDCKKALSTTEKMICSNDDLSELDSTLGGIFSSIKKVHPELLSDQKKWLIETRNACTTADCLKYVYTDRIATLKSFGDCPVNDLSLQGNWKREKSGPFEEMRFHFENNEKVFISWLHHRPEMTGTWNINKCVIHIEDKNSSRLEFDLQVKSLEKNVLRILDLDGNTEGSYRKLP